MLANVLETAIAYSPTESRVDRAADEDRSNVVISIEDEGRGFREGARMSKRKQIYWLSDEEWSAIKPHLQRGRSGEPLRL